MAPSKKGAKTQTQVVHHDEDDLIQVRDRDDARRIGGDEGTRMGPGWDAIIASRPEMDDGGHDWERYAMMGRGGGDATRDDAG